MTLGCLAPWSSPQWAVGPRFWVDGARVVVCARGMSAAGEVEVEVEVSRGSRVQRRAVTLFNFTKKKKRKRSEAEEKRER